MRTLRRIATGLVVSAAMATSAIAATDGSLAATSSGDAVVSLQVQDMVQISSVADISLGAYSGTGNMVGESEYCVYRSGGNAYSITLTTNETLFRLRSATTSDTIAFTVKVDDDLDASDGETLTYNTASAVSMNGAATTNCGGADNASVQVSFAEAALQAVGTANDYTATMTLLVQPI